jgi:hypothetical protein
MTFGLWTQTGAPVTLAAVRTQKTLISYNHRTADH